jgi:hypothetical protein
LFESLLEENRMKQLIAACATLGPPLLAMAHDGHGTQGVHWHATDTWGFVALALVAAAALWFGRRK